MTRWLVGNVPAGLLLAVLIVLIAGGAVLAQRHIRRRFPGLRTDEHNDVIKFTYGFVGFVYAFFVGFIVSAMWGQINVAEGKAYDEGAAGVQLAREAMVFEAADRDRIREALLSYENAAIAEWSRVDDGSSPEGDRALAGLYIAYEQIQVRTDAQKELLTRSFVNLDQMSQARSVRLITAWEDRGMPWPIWAVVFITSAMVLGTAVIYGVERARLHYPMVAVVGTVVAINFFLIIQLTHPFMGAISVSDKPLREVVHVLTDSPR